MEHLVRIVNDTDRQILAWLRSQVGDERGARAAQHKGRGRQPYLSAVCRSLGGGAARAPRNRLKNARTR